MLTAIKNDDLAAFDAITATTPTGGYRMGRFPVLSLLYLFSSRKILKKYEERFVKISVWEEVGEPVAISARFMQVAGKCLRLYMDEVVSPIEMLLILDKTRKVKRLYPVVRPSDAVRGRLKSIYYIKYSLKATVTSKTLIVAPRPLHGKEKMRLALAIVGAVVALAIIIATPVTVVSLMPKRPEGEVVSLSEINFASKNAYVLGKDVALPDDFYVEEANCTIEGGGHKLIFGKNAHIGVFSGALKDVEVQTAGDVMFGRCLNTASLSNVVINVTADVEMSESSSFVTTTNYGVFDNVTLNVNGKIYASKAPDGEDEMYFGGLAAVNELSRVSGAQTIYGALNHCRVNYDLILEGELEANATFGGIAGLNRGYIEDCAVSGKIVADTFDIAGVCYQNYYLVSGTQNRADLIETADVDSWTTVVGGIAIYNANYVQACLNGGNLSATSAGDAIIGGITARSYGQTVGCLSTGNMTATAKSICAGGITGISQLLIDGNYVYLGLMSECISAMDIVANADEGAAYAGGICGYVQEVGLRQYVYDEHGLPIPDGEGGLLTETAYWGGGASDCFFVGKLSAQGGYAGNIAGIVGAHIYEQNSFLAGGEEMNNFDGNVYLASSLPAYGATVTTDSDGNPDNFTTVEDKGATTADIEAIKASPAFLEILEELGVDPASI